MTNFPSSRIIALAAAMMAGGVSMTSPVAASASELDLSLVDASKLRPERYFDMDRFSSVVVDVESGQMLIGGGSTAPRYPASLTKVMTIFMAFEALDQGLLTWDQELTVSRHAARQYPIKLDLKAGKKITVGNAILAAAIKSANDAATALGEGMAAAMLGKATATEAEFAVLMNKRAKELGMTDTHFVNANGMPDEKQVTTPIDMVTLSKAMIEKFHRPGTENDYYAVFDRTAFKLGKKAIRGHNRLLDDNGVDGIKTGFIDASGYNIITSAVIHGRRVIIAVFGGKTGAGRDSYVRQLMEAVRPVMQATVDGERKTYAALTNR